MLFGKSSALLSEAEKKPFPLFSAAVCFSKAGGQFCMAAEHASVIPHVFYRSSIFLLYAYLLKLRRRRLTYHRSTSVFARPALELRS